jgi:hypothetical protein
LALPETVEVVMEVVPAVGIVNPIANVCYFSRPVKKRLATSKRQPAAR